MTYKIGYDIVIDDENCNDVGKEFTTIATSFENKLKNYLDSLDRVLEGAVKAGAVSNNLKDFQTEANTLSELLEDINEEITDTIKTFVSDMDKADNDLY
ncbi:hypothetical protein HCB27_14275 [Listeria booriae]|uniref:LXG domain-containing protein n=1 Tax=Listeria booriae TaxID=1552123 RepID=A0A7X0Z897_9LIST|nr:hypothetical protein [Listeria booriae]MBC2177784.1 hypothetical protein [Listeria booriae]MBC2177795.1 hypothetical protein [Listeria booriae]